MTITMEAQSVSTSKCVKRVWKSVNNCSRSERINGFSRRVAFPFLRNQGFLGAKNASIFPLIKLS